MCVSVSERVSSRSVPRNFPEDLLKASRKHPRELPKRLYGGFREGIPKAWGAVGRHLGNEREAFGMLLGKPFEILLGSFWEASWCGTTKASQKLSK